MMNTSSDSAPPDPVSSLLYSYRRGKRPDVTATTEKIIPLFALSDNHIDRDASEIIEIPSSHETTLSDHSIHMLEPISATTKGVNVVTAQPKVVTPLSRLRYIVCARASDTVAAICT